MNRYMNKALSKAMRRVMDKIQRNSRAVPYGCYRALSERPWDFVRQIKENKK
jgi:hypothetical protein